MPRDVETGPEGTKAPTTAAPESRVKLIARRTGSTILFCLLGAAAGWLCLKLNIPLPWMVGPLLLTAGVSMARGAPYAPVQLRWFGQLVVASAVALNLTAHAFEVAASHFWLMLVSALLIIMSSGVLAAIIMRTSGVDRATALFASLPGGPVEMATLAQHYGGHGGLVAFAQTMRIASIVTVIPPILILLGGEFHDLSEQPIETNFIGLILVLVIGLIASVILSRIGGSNAFFLGPLLGVGIASALGAPLAPIPGELIAAAQVALGVSLGRMFDRELILKAKTFVLQAAFISAVLITLAMLLAFIFARIEPESFYLYALGNAPGSITEMAVAAKALYLDVALVTAFHMLRIIIILPFATVIYRAFVQLTEWVERRRAD